MIAPPLPKSYWSNVLSRVELREADAALDPELRRDPVLTGDHQRVHAEHGVAVSSRSRTVCALTWTSAISAKRGVRKPPM